MAKKFKTTNKKPFLDNAEQTIYKTESLLKSLFSAKRLLAVIALLIIAILFGPKLFINKTGRVSSSVSSVLKDINVISELSTLLIPYNSIYSAEEPKKKDSDKTKYKYHVAYEGIVTLGLDLKKIQEPRKNDELHQIIIKLPEIKILDTQVFHDSLEVIYVDNKYNKEGSIIEIRKECDRDLQEKVKKESNVYKIARESAEDTIKNLILPLVEQQYKNYEIIFE